MRTGIINLLGNIPTRLNSHNAGWNYCIASFMQSEYNIYPEFINQVEEDLNNFDIICINNGVNYKENKFNFFGGVQQDTIDKLIALSKYNNELICYNEPIDFKHLLKRKEISIIPNREVVRHYTYRNKMIIGDSHSISIYKKGYGILRLDGKTLHGFLKDPYFYLNFNKLNDIILYFGNIDIRFHLCRQQWTLASTNELVKKYVKFLSTLVNKGKIVKVQGLLPIEDESRKIPGTGLYKGKPFYGSQSEREDLRNRFNYFLERDSKEHGYIYQEPWLDYPLDFSKMEAKQSVHISPENYLNKEFINVI